MPVSKKGMNMYRWFIREFDRSWVKCRSCKTLFLYNQMKRKNKCPKCKLDNHGCGSVSMNKIAENKACNEWWKIHGYKYKPESEEEADWVVIVKYWAWKGWEARAAKEEIL